MLKGFREFVLRGNVVDMAVGVVIGAAFGGIVTAFVKDLLTPLIAALVGKPDFSAYVFEAEWIEVSLRRFSQCSGRISLDCRGGILLCGAARQRPDGTHAEGATCRTGQEDLSGMPKRDSDCRAQVRVLHFGSCVIAWQP